MTPRCHTPRGGFGSTALGLLALAVTTGSIAIATAETATEIRPHPENANRARGPLPGDGCFLGKGEIRSPRCVYGVRDSSRRVVLFGDSHAMHHYPGMSRLVRERRWRLVVLTKAGCPPMLVVKRPIAGEATECSRWRRSALRRIARRERPDLVIAGGSMNYRTYDRTGERHDDDARDAALESSYIRVLRRLRRSGARTVVMKDVPKPPFDVPGCVAESLERPNRCAFDLPAGHWRTFDTRAARATGSRLVAVTPSICRDGRCRAVISKRLVYRAGSHLTAPFARTLRPELERRLPRVR